MKAFVAVVEANGFSSAARKTGLTKAVLSKHVAQLEEKLDTRLLQRTTRHVSPTEVGRIYYKRCLPLLEELEELESVVHQYQSNPSGELRLSAPISFAELHLVKVVAEFSRRYPDIRVHMDLTDRNVDIVEEGFDLALRIGKLNDSSLVARPLGRIRLVTYASPQYLEQYGEPKSPEQLAKHRCIIDTNYRKDARWNFKQGEQSFATSVQGVCYVNSPTAVRALALQHQGIALSPLFVVEKDIAEQRLQLVLCNYEIETFGLYAIFSHRRRLSVKVRLFIDLLLEYSASMAQ